jgi:hypothetical protein
MSGRYGGIGGTNNIADIPEATIVGEAIEESKPTSRLKVILFTLLLWWVTWQITTLAIMATGISEQSYYRSLPSFVGFYVIPSIPFFAIMFWRSVKISHRKEAGD